MVAGEDALSELLLSAVDVSVQLVAILANRELLVVIDWNVDATRAHWLVLWVVELSHIWVT